MRDGEESRPRPRSGSAPDRGEPDAGVTGDWGPADWCASGIGGNAADGLAATGDDTHAPNAAGTSGIGPGRGVPGALLAPASELPAGRRRRRSALEEVGTDRLAGAPAREDAAPHRFSYERSAGTGGAATDAAFAGSAFAHGEAGDESEEHPEGRGRRAGGRRRGGRRQGGRPDGEGAREAGGPGRGARSEEPADPAARARDICLRLLTGTAKTRKQLADALRKREIPDEVADEVLGRLEEVGLIDDAAFADAWVESRHAGRGLARRALAQELRTRGVAGELVEQAVAQLGADEEAEAARALVERKLRSTRGVERQARTRRLVGMLARRGYSEGLAYRVVREALGEEAEELDDNDW